MPHILLIAFAIVVSFSLTGVSSTETTIIKGPDVPDQCRSFPLQGDVRSPCEVVYAPMLTSPTYSPSYSRFTRFLLVPYDSFFQFMFRIILREMFRIKFRIKLYSVRLVLTKYSKAHNFENIQISGYEPKCIALFERPFD